MTSGRSLVFTPGQKFGQLTVVAVRRGNQTSPRRVECRCDCGAPYLAVPHHLHRGATLRCFGCWPKRRTAEYIRFRRRLNNYKHNSKHKNLSFNFSPDEFRKFYEAACAYCGIVPAGGIDRRDNTLGYVDGNCAPACAQCNYAKRNMSEASFLAWVARLATNQGFSL